MSGLTLEIAAGQTTSQGTVTITAVNNDEASGDATVRVAATAANEQGVTAPEPVDLVIEDDDTATPVIVVAREGLKEITEGEPARFQISADPAPTEPITVPLRFEGDDYLLADQDFPESVTLSAIMNVFFVFVDTDDDDVDEPNGSVTATAVEGDGYVVNERSQATVQVEDDDLAPTASLILDPPAIPENEGVANVKAELSHPSSASTSLTVTALAVAPATADDFTVSGLTLEIAAGQTTSQGTVTITAVNNDEASGDATVRVAATAANDQGVTAPDTVDLVIEDDDRIPVVSIANDLSSIDAVAEGTAIQIDFIASFKPLEDLTLNLRLSGADHFLGDTPQDRMRFPAGSTSATTYISTIDDTQEETSQLLRVELIEGTGYTVGTVSRFFAHIIDDDGSSALATPEPIEVTPRNQRLKLSWPRVSGALKYLVRYRRMDEPVPNPWLWDTTVTNERHTLRDLENGVTYVVQVRAGSNIAFSHIAEATGTPAGVGQPATKKHIESVTQTPPAVVGVFSGISLEVEASTTVEVAPYFTGDSLTYSAVAMYEDVAAATVTRGLLTVTGRMKGETTITLTAYNDAGEASHNAPVTVTADTMEKRVYESVLSAMGRGMLSGVMMTLGDRFSTGGHDRHKLSLAGRRVVGLDSGLLALIGVSGHHIPSHWNESIRQDTAVKVDMLRNSSFNYTMHGGRPATTKGSRTASSNHSLAFWGTGNVQSFRATPASSRFDGQMRAAFVGVDISKPSWITGLSVSRNVGTSTYSSQVGQGRMRTLLTSAYPYFFWKSVTHPIEAWSILGVGRGTVSVGGLSGRLSMRMGMLGFRTQWTRFQGTNLNVVGHVGLMKLLASSEGKSTLDGLDADVRSVRLGIEGTNSSLRVGGLRLTPFAQVAGRYDGGDGVTGRGLEVAGGLRLAIGRLGIEARGRMLAVHTASGYEEKGLAVIAFVRPEAGRGGLSVSISPRWGSETRNVDLTWREDRDIVQGERPPDEAGTVRAHIGYGMVYPTMNGLVVTPFCEMDLSAADHRRMRVGTRLGSLQVT